MPGGDTARQSRSRRGHVTVTIVDTVVSGIIYCVRDDVHSTNADIDASIGQ